MDFIIKAALGLLMVDGFLIVILVVKRFFQSPSQVPLTDLGIPVATAAGLVALFALALKFQRDKSDDYLQTATKLLERAYEVLSTPDDLGRPKNSRLNWLAAARFIRASQKLSTSISVDSHSVRYREEREYWRARFFELIMPGKGGFPKDYFAEKPMSMIAYGEDERPPLSERSLAVLYRFIRWDGKYEDPIKDEPDFTDKEIESMRMFDAKGLGNLLAEVRQIRKKGA